MAVEGGSRYLLEQVPFKCKHDVIVSNLVRGGREEAEGMCMPRQRMAKLVERQEEVTL